MSIALPTLDRSDLRDVTRTTRVAMSASLVVHALLLLWLVLTKAAPRVQDSLTEVTLLDANEAAAGSAAAGSAGAPAAARVQVAEPGSEAPSDEDRRFRRESRADVAPQPQSDVALDDRIQSRLAELQRVPSLAAASGAAGGPVVAESPSLAGVSGTGGLAGSGEGNPLSLTRGGATGSAPSLSLSRGGGTGRAPSLAVAAGAMTAPPSASGAVGGDAGARRMVSGAMLAGPIADRPVLAMVTPVYPEWAKRDGAEGSVTLYFIVRPDGSVKENVLVQKTAGFQDFDESAQVALRRWRFEPLHGGRTGEQWGTITFHFRLRDAT